MAVTGGQDLAAGIIKKNDDGREVLEKVNSDRFFGKIIQL